MATEFDIKIDYYEILQVHPKADVAVIRSAYRAIVRELQVHPDLGGSHDEAVVVNDAYRVLSDAELRAQYDNARQDYLSHVPQEAPSVPKAWKQVVCLNCGQHNHVSPLADKEKITCTACRKKLFPDPFRVSASPQNNGGKNTLNLNDALYEDLKAKGELELRMDTVPRGGKITCRRCRRVWVATSRGKSPSVCPICKAEDWKTFRIFKCRLCGLEFTSNSLRRNPYLLFPTCPACDRPKWHNGLESSPLNGLLRFLRG